MNPHEKKATLEYNLTFYRKDYERFCKYLFKGRYLWEDLFQEFTINFLTMSDHCFNKCASSDKKTAFKEYGNSIICNLYKNRGRAKKRCDGSTSPLFETENVNINIDDYFFEEDTYEEKEERYKEIEETKTKVDKIIQRELSSKNGYLNMAIFVQAQNETLKAMSQKTRIGRGTLYYRYGLAEQLIRKEL